MLLVLVAFFAPVIARGYTKLRKGKSQDSPIRLGLYHRCVLVFLAYALLIGPFGFEQLAHGSTQYSQITTLDWSSGNRTIEYDYDENGSVTEKLTWDDKGTTTTADDVLLEQVSYAYNLQNRLWQVTTDDQSGTDSVVEYTYNDAGIKVQAYSYDYDGQAKSNETTKLFLIDAYNHTGYAQILEQWTDGQTPDVTYTIGDDVITQSGSGGVRHLLYDGHGSTRQLVDSSENVSNYYSYDAYGVMLGGNPARGSTPATDLLYAGEHFDTDMQQYYLRARWYNQNNGCFNRMDTFAGNNQDPQSLHKYLYVHNNPVNGIDPTGMFSDFSIQGLLSNISIRGIVSSIGSQLLSGVLKAVRYFVLPMFLTYMIVNMFADYPVTNVKLLNSVQNFQEMLNSHSQDIVQYAQNNGIGYITQVSDVPQIENIDLRESRIPNLIAEKYGITVAYTEPFSHRIRFFTNWLELDTVTEMHVLAMLIHEYGHVLYGNKPSNMLGETPASDFAEWFVDLE